VSEEGNGGGRGMIPFFPRGQIESTKRGKATERDLPLQQTGANIVLWAGAFLLLLANVLIIGPLLGVSIILVVGGYVMILIHLWSVGTRIEGWVLITGLFVGALWLWLGPPWVNSIWFDSRSTWRPIYKATFAIFSLVVVGILGMNIWRFLYEVVDPNAPGTVGIRPAEWGIMWPWSEIPSEEPEVVIQTVERVREVPRPVPTGGTAHIVPEQPPDPARVERNGGKTILAPSGREVRVSDLTAFIRIAPQPHSKPAFSAWKGKRRPDGWSEWDLDAWQDVVDVWAMYGIVTKRENGKKTRILVSDFTEAMGMLSSAFD